MPPSPTSRATGRLSTHGCARSSTGTSTRRPARRSGSTSRRRRDGIRAARSRASPTCSASASSRTNGCAAARCSAGSRRRSPASRSSCSRPAARPAFRRRAIASDDFRIDYELFSETLPDEYFPQGANWLMLGPSGPRRLRLAVEHLAQYPRRHLLLRRSRSALGDQADQEGLERAPAGLQGSRDRPGGHDPRGRARHPLHVRDAEAARSARAAARVDGDDASGRRGSPASSPAAPSSRRSGTASRTRSCSTAPT